MRCWLKWTFGLSEMSIGLKLGSCGGGRRLVVARRIGKTHLRWQELLDAT